ncbi:MAG TPA: ABC transporter ATP-binding protein [Trebonia sp.]
MPELPSSWISLWRSMKLGYRVEPLLLVASGVTTLAAALPDALFALGFAWFTSALIAGQRARLLESAAVIALFAVGTWLLRLASGRVNLRLNERAAVPIEAHAARLQSSIVTIDHQERSAYLDQLEMLRDHGSVLPHLYQSAFSVTGVIARLLVTIALLMSVQPWLGLLAVFAVPGIAVAARRAPAEKRAELAGAADRRLARHLFVLGATAASSKELRVSGTQHMVRRLRAAAWNRQYRIRARQRSVTALWQAASGAAFGAAFVACAVWTALGPGTHAAKAGEVALVVTAGARLSQYVAQAAGETHILRGMWLYASRQLAWLEDYAAARAVTAGQPAPAEFRTGIRLENVSFRYAGSPRPVLQDVSLTVPAGTVVAIVGENGAGKSTLVKLLCRFYEPSAGRVTVDGTDLARIDPRQWRERLAGTFQDFFRFEYPAALAIGIGDLPRARDREAVSRAVTRAGADEVVSRLPDGLGTQLGGTWRDGAELSTGQWQRIALARGFMRDDPLLLILDEPTSALDAETGHAIFQRYADAARAAGKGSESGRTSGAITVLVSHRFSTVRLADLIVVLDGARVRETGSHAELMARNGVYADLYRIQRAAYRQ